VAGIGASLLVGKENTLPAWPGGQTRVSVGSWLWSPSTGISGRLALDQVVAIKRNRWSQSTGLRNQ